MLTFRISLGNIDSGIIVESYIKSAKNKEDVRLRAEYLLGGLPKKVNTFWIEEINLVSFPEDEGRR